MISWGCLLFAGCFICSSNQETTRTTLWSYGWLEGKGIAVNYATPVVTILMGNIWHPLRKFFLDFAKNSVIIPIKNYLNVCECDIGRFFRWHMRSKVLEQKWWSYWYERVLGVNVEKEEDHLLQANDNGWMALPKITA